MIISYSLLTIFFNEADITWKKKRSEIHGVPVVMSTFTAHVLSSASLHCSCHENKDHGNPRDKDGEYKTISTRKDLVELVVYHPW